MNLTAIKPQGYPRTKHIFGSPGASKDDVISFNKDSVKVFLNKRIIITEKLDGENTGITNIATYARSKIPSINPWSVNIRELFPFVKGFISDDEIVFGENLYAVHSIEYNKLPSYFYIFAVYNTKDNIWYSWNDVVDMAAILELPTVPVLFDGILNSTEELYNKIDTFMSQPSTYGVEKEGVVIRSASEITPDEWNDSIAKWVRANHVRTTDKRWEDHWEKAKLINTKSS